MPNTGNAGGVRNLVVEPTAGDLDSLLKDMGTGLLVTELIGHGINMVTGDYSRGASGFWVENGELAYPVEEITIAGNLKNMFRDIRAVGSDVDLRGSIRTGSILLDQLMIAGE
jgi:PmbA protein